MASMERARAPAQFCNVRTEATSDRWLGRCRFGCGFVGCGLGSARPTPEVSRFGRLPGAAAGFGISFVAMRQLDSFSRAARASSRSSGTCRPEITVRGRRRGSLERGDALDGLIEGDAEREQVARGPGLLAVDAFGCEVLRSSNDAAHGGEAGVVLVGRDPEVGQQDPAVLSHHDVRWLHIPMNDPGLVRCIQGLQHGFREIGDRLWRQREVGEYLLGCCRGNQHG